MRRVAILVLLALAACSPTVPTLTPTATAVPSHTPRFAATLPNEYPTLPPTWTPTFTSTATLTPSITPTFTLTPTADEAALCADFVVTYTFKKGHLYKTSHTFSFVVNTGYTDVKIIFSLTQRSTKKTYTFELPSNFFIAEMPIQYFPDYGLYDWSLSITRGGKSGLCQYDSSFLVYAVHGEPPLMDVPGEATPEVTAEN